MSTSEGLERIRESEGARSVLSGMRRRWLLVGAIIVACVAVAVVVNKRTPKSYSASANVAFQSGTLSDSALQITPVGTSEPQREANTEVLVAHSPEVAAAVRRQLGLSKTPSQLLKEVKVETAPSSDVLNITASSTDPRSAAQLANAFAAQYIAFRAKSELKGINEAQSTIQKQIDAVPAGSAERANLQTSLQRLGELRAVAGSGASIIGRASAPSEPSSMKLSTSAVLGLIVGIALAFSVVFLLESLDRRVKSVDEFARQYKAPLLGSVPQSAFRFGRADQRSESLESYRILRTALDFAAVTRELDTLLVTSAVSGEGKTTVAVDLAHAIALTGRPTVLMEVDLRRPTLAQHFAADTHGGLTEALVGRASAKSLLIEPLPEVPDLHVLLAGRIPHNPAELLASSRIAQVISELAEPGTMVIVDAPPLNPVADAQALLNVPEIHGALMVARLGTTTRDDVHRARTIMNNHMVQPVGVVVTGLRDSTVYGYDPYRRNGRETKLELSADVLARPGRRAPARPPRI